jgi:ankyrin repeat protein
MKYFILIIFKILFFFSNYTFYLAQEFDEHGEIPIKLEDKVLYRDLFKSCERGDIERVKFLVEAYSPDIEKKDKKGSTPLLISSASGHLEIVKYLLSKKVNINIQDKLGNTPLNISLQRGHLNIAKFLLENKLNVELHNKSNSNPLLIASANGYSEIVRILLTFKPNLNHTDDLGNNALHYSILGGHEDISALLLENKINYKTKNKTGKSAIALASQSGVFELLNLFKTSIPKGLIFLPIGEVTTEINEEGICSIKIFPKFKSSVGINQIFYIVNEQDEIKGNGKIFLTNPKFSRLKVENVKINLGDKIGFFE